MIRCDDISVEINEKSILTRVSIAPEVGEVSVILGPNGAGKSTLLKCLSGVLHPSCGRVLLDGRALIEYSLNALAKNRAVLSQSNPITFPFTVCEIVMMGRNPHITRDYSMHDIEVVNQVLASLDAQSLKDRIFQNLSGGEQQRVQIARVLAQIWDVERACLLLDEPTAALDLKHQHEVLQFIRMLAEERKWAIVVVIHDLHLAKRYADKAILMKDGTIYRQDKVRAVLIPEHISTVFEIPPELAAV